MLFNSFPFLVFFGVVYLLYLSGSPRWQNRLLLGASLFFYGWWDYRFLALILFSVGLDYVCGLKLHEAQNARRRRAWLIVSLAGNLGLLGFFKYFHFFVDSSIDLVTMLGLQAHRPTLQVILPVGISFYTFQTLSYTLDIYRGRMKPTTDFLNFALFVTFFPQLLAGPIERARNLLPQIERPRTITPAMIREGVYLFTWGLFKKILMADNVAPIVNHIFAHADQASTADVMLGLLAFALQIYCDYSAYSDMARGLGKLMGFHIMVNFRFPDFATSLSDFWARWHISLSTWVRDYVFLSIGANRRGNLRTAFNILLAMTLIGLWHGASWNFVLWGFYFGVLQAGQLLLLNVRRRKKTRRPLWRALVTLWQVLITRLMIVSSMILFRTEDMAHTLQMGRGIFSGFDLLPETWSMIRLFCIIWLPLRLFEYWQYRQDDPLLVLRQPGWVRYLIYCAIATWGYLIYILSASLPIGEEFIYFQF